LGRGVADAEQLVLEFAGHLQAVAQVGQKDSIAHAAAFRADDAVGIVPGGLQVVYEESRRVNGFGQGLV
jgi:hypothetical protein